MHISPKSNDLTNCLLSCTQEQKKISATMGQQCLNLVRDKDVLTCQINMLEASSPDLFLSNYTY